MLTLTYGLKLPQTNDKGPIVFPAMEGNITQLDAHNHDGANSSLLSASSIVADVETLLAVNWVSLGNGMYRQLVTVSAGHNFDTVTINFRLPDGSYVYPTVERVNTTSYYVYTNDNTVAYTAVYGG